MVVSQRKLARKLLLVLFCFVLLSVRMLKTSKFIPTIRIKFGAANFYRQLRCLSYFGSNGIKWRERHVMTSRASVWPAVTQLAKNLPERNTFLKKKNTVDQIRTIWPWVERFFEIIKTLKKRYVSYMYRQFNIQQFPVPPTQCIYVFCVDLRTNSDYFPIQHGLVFITETENVYCAVRTESLHVI